MFVSERPERLPFPAGSGLNWGHYDLLRLIGQMPWSSALDQARVKALNHARIYERLGDLHDRGYVRSNQLGATMGKVERYYLTAEGLSCLEVVDGVWNSEWALARLLEKLPQVEWFYRACVDQVERLGPMVRFRWFRSVSWDAAVRYSDGWVAFFWSGVTQSEGRLRETFSELGRDLVRYSVVSGGAFPSVLCFIVCDSWQRQLVFRAARAFGLEGHVQVWCVDDGSVSGVRERLTSSGWVQQILDGGGLGAWPLQKRLEASIFSRQNPKMTGRLLDAVLEWPGLGTRFGEQLLAEPPETKRVTRLLRSMSDDGLLRRYENGRGLSYVVDSRGFDVLSRRDRMNIQRRLSNARFAAGPEERGLGRHERGLMRMVSLFLEGGAQVASGIRAWEHMWSAGGIGPDALIYLRESPFGPGWHYLEYELRVRGMTGVTKKLRGYGSSHRQDNWPVLVAARNPRVEQLFREAGMAGRLRLITTNVERYEEGLVLGDGRVWSVDGNLVVLG